MCDCNTGDKIKVEPGRLRVYQKHLRRWVTVNVDTIKSVTSQFLCLSFVICRPGPSIFIGKNVATVQRAIAEAKRLRDNAHSPQLELPFTGGPDHF